MDRVESTFWWSNPLLRLGLIKLQNITPILSNDLSCTEPQSDQLIDLVTTEEVSLRNCEISCLISNIPGSDCALVDAVIIKVGVLESLLVTPQISSLLSDRVPLSPFQSLSVSQSVSAFWPSNSRQSQQTKASSIKYFCCSWRFHATFF